MVASGGFGNRRDHKSFVFLLFPTLGVLKMHNKYTDTYVIEVGTLVSMRKVGSYSDGMVLDAFIVIEGH